ncbi:MAG: tRNA (adenosine(37)-N6)-threonylcarbamoyltransferase complex dimerization subunit type 1 TsaB [marine bacterium B5-7]|nr:MAG: tRNA (adenosine(37)-N6)-threonylcarbamoyltransferase complex dimerization subunit type 1 TsaB [marine bacterium B5-7]
MTSKRSSAEKTMKILAIETATEACSAALDIDDNCIHRFQVSPRRHTELILPMIDDLLREADIQTKDLDAISFGQGPGAFTGVRIAVGVIQGLAFAHDTPVIPISSLNALAQHYADEHSRVATAIDARMQEIYWGLFKKNDLGLMLQITEEKVCPPQDISNPSKGDWFGAGSGWNTYSEELQTQFNQKLIGFNGDVFPSAKDIITLAKPAYLEGKAIPVEEAMPVYLRNKVVNK